MQDNSIDAQLEHWNDRAKQLEEWKTKHDYSHPNWQQNSRDLNNAYWKIKQLNDRQHRPASSALPTYSLPKIN